MKKDGQRDSGASAAQKFIVSLAGSLVKPKLMQASPQTSF